MFKATVTDSQLRAWRRQGYTHERICEATGMSSSELSHRLHEIYSAPQVGDPTEEEIARGCAAIQQGWSPAERRKRCVTHSGRWRPAVVPASVLASARSWQGGFDELPEFTPTCVRS